MKVEAQDINSGGWIKIYKSVMYHWIWDDANKLKWWIDILMKANYLPKKIAIGYTLIDCGRGECVMSLQSWAKRWGVSKTTVRSFLNMLEADEMITIKNETVTTRITICNYDKYQQQVNVYETQTERIQNGDETETKRDSTQHKKEEEVKERKERISLFRNAGISLEQFKEKLDSPEFNNIDFQHYYNEIMDWSSGGNKMKADWIATARNWIRRSKADGKLKTVKSKPMLSM